MNNEQNIDDILRLLQEQVDSLEDNGELSGKENTVSSDISTDDLTEKLKAHFFSDGYSENTETDSSYDIDSDFLAEFKNDGAEADDEDAVDEISEFKPVEEIAEDGIIDVFANGEMNGDSAENADEDDVADEVFFEDEVEEYSTDKAEEISPIAVEEFADTSAEAFNIAESENAAKIAEEDTSESDPLQKQSYSSPVAIAEYDEDAEEVSEDFEIIEETEEAEENEEIPILEEAEEINVTEASAYDAEESLASEDAVDGELYENTEAYDDVIDRQTEIDCDDMKEGDDASETEEEVSAPAFDPYAVDLPKQKPMSFKALMMDYGRPDPIPSPSADEKFADTELAQDLAEEETPDIGDILSDFADEAPTAEERVNLSMHKLMNSLGCEDELKNISPEALGAVYSDVSDDQNTDGIGADKTQIKDDYKKTVVLSALKLTACAVMTLIMFLYDTLPIFDIEFFSPSVYVLIGAQLLILTAVCLWRPMLDGLKRLLTPNPNIYSMAAVLVGFNIAYDTVLFITGGYMPQEIPMFHFVSGAVMLSISLTELLMHIREARAYDLYSTDVAKFTFTYDKSANSIGEKMYGGGFSRDKKVYTLSPVSEPRGFFDAIRDGGEFDGAVYRALIFGSVAVCAIVGIIFMIAKSSVDIGAAAAMTSAVMMLPVGAVISLRAPLLLSSKLLRARGIALTGRGAIRKYGSENAIVFNDLHLFSKCEPRDVGFVCYEKLQTKNILAALQILYARIGGPMCKVFANVPESCRAKTIRVRRITRSGIEAVVDKSHTLVVGDVEFLRRYGIEFPKSEGGTNGKNATLYISLDGRASAKLTAKYSVEPIFDMLIERLAKDGIHCVVETYDPMINTAFVAKQRRSDRAPISVVHKNAADINRKADNAKKRSDHGVLAVSSRLKLAEAAVWCARLCKIDKISNIIVYSSVGLGFIIAIILAIFVSVPYYAQYLIALYFGAVAIGITALAFALFPRKNYFTVKALQKEDDEKEKKINEQKKEKDQ